jgi:hypothetical protein
MIIILQTLVRFKKKFMFVVRGIQNCEFSGPWGPNGWQPLIYNMHECLFNYNNLNEYYKWRFMLPHDTQQESCGRVRSAY